MQSVEKILVIAIAVTLVFTGCLVWVLLGSSESMAPRERTRSIAGERSTPDNLARTSRAALSRETTAGATAPDALSFTITGTASRIPRDSEGRQLAPDEAMATLSDEELERKSSAGDPIAAFVLAGRLARSNPEQALVMASQSADAGYFRAMHLEGTLLQTTKGASEDIAAAYERARMTTMTEALNHQDSEAMRITGMMAQRGQGQPRDALAAYIWLRAANQAGSQGAGWRLRLAQRQLGESADDVADISLEEWLEDEGEMIFGEAGPTSL